MSENFSILHECTQSVYINGTKQLHVHGGLPSTITDKRGCQKELCKGIFHLIHFNIPKGNFKRALSQRDK